MPEQAKVADLETLERVRVAMLHAAEQFQAVLQEVEAEVQRVQDWLDDDQPAAIRRAARKAQDQVVQCKSALFNKQTIRATADSRPSVVDERKALDRALARLEAIEFRLRGVQRWSKELPTQRAVFIAGTRPLRTAIDRDIPRSAETLRRMADHLEEYLRGGDDHDRVLRAIFGQDLPAPPPPAEGEASP